MRKVTISGIVKTSIVTAFTIAAALIWKDVIIATINLIFPPQDFLFYQFLAATIATIIVVISIYVILKTEQQTEKAFYYLNHRNKKWTIEKNSNS